MRYVTVNAIPYKKTTQFTDVLVSFPMFL